VLNKPTVDRRGIRGHAPARRRWREILRATPDIPTLAAVIAFEHHLARRHRLSLSSSSALNLGTMLQHRDVFDAMRSQRSLPGRATD
jgi:hypothetical protein